MQRFEACLIGGLLLGIGTLTSQAAEQVVSGDPVQIGVKDSATPGILVKAPGAAGYMSQYYGVYGWGSVVWLNGTDATQKYSSGYVSAPAHFTPVSNTTTVVGTTSTITTVVDLGTSGIRLTQQFVYVDGERTVAKQWTLANTGATTYDDVRFFHGGDTYFGGQDDGYGFYDAPNSMVYIRNTDYTNWGLMGFYANPATPANRYFEGDYSTGNIQASTDAQLSNTADPTFVDAGYYLQWNRATLAPGETWTVQATETWTPPGATQVLAPSNQAVVAGAVLDLAFTVHNLSASPVDVTLSAADTAGWGASISGSTSQTVPANGSISVTVHVTVPGGVNPGDTSSVSLSANDGATLHTASSLLTVSSVAFSLSPSEAAFGPMLVGSVSSQTVTVTNTSGAGITLGALGAIAAPFSKSLDACSGQSLAVGGTCTFDVEFAPSAVGAFNGSLNVPVVAPAILSSTLNVSGSGVDATPTPVPTASPTPSPMASPSPTVRPTPRPIYHLDVAVSGSGGASGTVTSAPHGIDCGIACGAWFPVGGKVYLTARPQAGSVLAGWVNCDQVQADQTCVITMRNAKQPQVVAQFSPAVQPTPTAQPSPTATPVPGATPAPTPTPTPSPTVKQAALSVLTVGEGVVSSSAGGIDCGPVCSASFDAGSVVTLTAVPAEGYKFKRWSGADCENKGKKPCRLKLNKSRTVTAKFVRRPR